LSTAVIDGKARQLKGQEMYSKLYYSTKIQPVVEETLKEKGKLPKGEKLNIIKQITKELYLAESEEVKSEVQEKIDERAREAKTAECAAERTADQYLR
jgi:hypothetical protein